MNFRKYNIHFIEDIIRYLLYTSNISTELELLIFNNILNGRILNAKKNNAKLDSRHAKAQMINIVCLSIYITNNKYYTIRLVHVLKDHLSYIMNYLLDENNINNNIDKLHYRFCKEWYLNTIIILDNTHEYKNIIYDKFKKFINKPVINNDYYEILEKINILYKNNKYLIKKEIKMEEINDVNEINNTKIYKLC
jgi:hypothetical protein